MGEKDISEKEYISNPEIFADLINGCIYNHRQVILPEMIREVDTVSSTSVDGERKQLRIRDVIKEAEVEYFYFP